MSPITTKEKVPVACMVPLISRIPVSTFRMRLPLCLNTIVVLDFLEIHCCRLRDQTANMPSKITLVPLEIIVDVHDVLCNTLFKE